MTVRQAGPPPQAPVLTARQLQQLACAPTTVGLQSFGAGAQLNNNPQPVGGVGFRYTGADLRRITGVVGGVAGQCIQFYNDGNGTLGLVHDGGGSNAANRFWVPGAVSGGEFRLAPREHAILVYDAGRSRWVLATDGDAKPTTNAGVDLSGCIASYTGLSPNGQGGSATHLLMPRPANYPADSRGWLFQAGGAKPKYETLDATGVPIGQCFTIGTDLNTEVTLLKAGAAGVPTNRFQLPENSDLKVKQNSLVVLQYRDFGGTSGGRWVVTSVSESE